MARAAAPLPTRSTAIDVPGVVVAVGVDVVVGVFEGVIVLDGVDAGVVDPEGVVVAAAVEDNDGGAEAPEVVDGLADDDEELVEVPVLVAVPVPAGVSDEVGEADGTIATRAMPLKSVSTGACAIGTNVKFVITPVYVLVLKETMTLPPAPVVPTPVQI